MRNPRARREKIRKLSSATNNDVFTRSFSRPKVAHRLTFKFVLVFTKKKKKKIIASKLLYCFMQWETRWKLIHIFSCAIFFLPLSHIIVDYIDLFFANFLQLIRIILNLLSILKKAFYISIQFFFFNYLIFNEQIFNAVKKFLLRNEYIIRWKSNLN